jgi:hypothetical protein
MTEQATSTSREETATGDDSARASDATPETPFTNLDDYLALRRLGGLALSPDGIRLVTLSRSEHLTGSASPPHCGRSTRAASVRRGG